MTDFFSSSASLIPALEAANSTSAKPPGVDRAFSLPKLAMTDCLIASFSSPANVIPVFEATNSKVAKPPGFD
jgi:hypothetical protein